MRPYRRKHHPSWRTRRYSGIVNGVGEYLEPFVYNTKMVWMLEPPFPVTAKITITILTWSLLFLPLFYFLVPPLVTILLVNHFSEKWSFDDMLTHLGEMCANATNGTMSRKKASLPFKIFDRFSIFFFVYDYYQILRCLREA